MSIKRGSTKNKSNERRLFSAIVANRNFWIAVICALAMIAVDKLGLYGASIPIKYYVPLHLLLELSSIVVCFAVFATGWFGYKQTKNNQDLLIAITFLTAGAIDLVHTLSYKGMPNFLSANTPGLAAAYWLAARMAVGIGLLAASLTSPQCKSKWMSPRSLVCLSLLVIVASTFLFTKYDIIVGHSLFSQIGQPPTALKIGLEYLIIAIYLTVFFTLSPRRGWDRSVINILRSALIVAVFTELAFTLYISPFAWMNALGHAFKTAAYYFILSALFVSAIQRPHTQLSDAKEELQALYIDAQEHRHEIEGSFSRIGSALSSSLKLDEALDLIAELTSEMLHVDCSIVASLDKGSNGVRVAAQRGGCHEAHRPIDLTLQVGKQAIEERKTIIINDLKSTQLVTCTYTDPKCLRSMVCTPMIYEDDILGIIAIYSHTNDAFEEGDAKLLEAFATHAAVAIHNAISYERESNIANVLQMSIIGSSEIFSDRFDIAQVYVPAMNEALVGGDFYDVIKLTDDKIGLVIGDVSGKGLKAAVHTAMAKYSLRAFITEGHSPAAALTLLNKTIDEFTESDTFITMFYATLDLKTGELVYANAGHEPPILVSKGAYHTLQSTGPALGLGVNIDHTEDSLLLKSNDILLMYTDGISEARRGNMFMGTEGIGEKLLSCDISSSDDIAKCVYDSALNFAKGVLRDDAAILAVRAKS